MIYYGIHNFEKAKGNTLEFNYGEFIDKLKIPSYLIEISPSIIFIDNDSLVIIDYNNKINQLINTDVFTPEMIKTEYLSNTLFNESSIINYTENLITYDITNNIFDLTGNITLNISKIDSSEGIYIENLKINSIDIDATFEYVPPSELEILLSVIFNNIIQTKVSIIDQTYEYCYNILFNNLNINKLFNNIFNLYGSLETDSTLILNLVDIDSTIIQSLDNTDNVYYNISTEEFGLKSKLYYNNIIQHQDYNKQTELSTKIPYHKHSLNSIDFNPNSTGGLLYINDKNEVNIENNIKINNITIKNNEFILDLTNLNSNALIKEYKNVELFLNNFDNNLNIVYYDETVGNNVYYYITGANISFNINLTQKFNNWETNKEINHNIYYDNSSNDIIDLFDNNYMYVYLVCNKENQYLNIMLVDKTNQLQNEKIILNKNLDITYLLGIYELKIIQETPIEIPQFNILNIYNNLFPQNFARLFNIKNLLEITFYNSNIIPIYINKEAIIYITSDVPDEQENSYLHIRKNDSTNSLLYIINQVNTYETLKTIQIIKNTQHHIDSDSLMIYLVPPQNNNSSNMIIYLIN